MRLGQKVLELVAIVKTMNQMQSAIEHLTLDLAGIINDLALEHPEIRPKLTAALDEYDRRRVVRLP